MELSDLYKRIVPANVRTYASTALGNREKITENDFSKEELQTLKKIYLEKQMANARREQALLEQYKGMSPQEYLKNPDTELMNDGTGRLRPMPISYEERQRRLLKQIQSFYKDRNKTSVSYGDYHVKSGENAAPVIHNLPSTVYQSATDPRFALSGTLGSFNFRERDGRLKAEDNYGFREDQQAYYNRDPNGQRAVDKAPTTLIKEYWNQPGSLGEIMYRKYLGNANRPVEIDLGPKEE